MNLDGTNTYSFLIDEKNQSNFAPKSLKDLTIYFEEKERKAIELQQRLEYEKKLRAAENEKQIAQARLDAERARTATLELEAKNQVELERQIANERKRQEEEEKRKKNQKKVELSVKERRKLENEAAKVVKSADKYVFFGILFLVASFSLICTSLTYYDLKTRPLLRVIGVAVFICSIIFFISYSSTKKELIKKYKEEHSPDDPLIEHLDKV